MNQKLEQAISQWLKWDKEEKTRNEIETLVKNGEFTQLSKLLENRLEFGTAGLRAKMGAGFSQMNTLTILQTAQGLLKYAQTQFSSERLKKKVC